MCLLCSAGGSEFSVDLSGAHYAGDKVERMAPNQALIHALQCACPTILAEQLYMCELFALEIAQEKDEAAVTCVSCFMPGCLLLTCLRFSGLMRLVFDSIIAYFDRMAESLNRMNHL